MYLERKKLFYLIGGVVILLILLGLVLYFFKVRKIGQVPGGVATTTSTAEEINSNQPAPVMPGTPAPARPPLTKGELTDVYFKQLTQMFVERYGSYSNQNDNSHINDVLPLVTKSMAKWLTTQDIEQKNEYLGVTTRVVAMRITEKTDTKVTVAFDAQMEVSSASTKKNEYGSGRVNLEKVGEDWKVSGYYLDK